MGQAVQDVTIFLIEDNEVDVMGVKRAFRKSNFSNTIIVASDGVEALEKLKAGDVNRPFLVLLDINMPRMDGIEFLQALRQDPDLKSAVVFILTTSAAPEDLKRAYAQNIAGYIVKGKETGFVNAAELLDHYARVCELP